MLTFQDFLISLTNNLQQTLSTLGSSPINDNSSDYAAAISQVATAETNRKKISITGKNNRIITYDHGYDFTGFIDVNTTEFRQAPLSIRTSSRFLEIRRVDFANLCEYLLSTISRPLLEGENIGNLLDVVYRPGTVAVDIQQSSRQVVYSYLNISADVDSLISSVVLPPTVLSMKLGLTAGDTNKFYSSQNIMTSIVKLNKMILENNELTLSGINNNKFILKEDLISILANAGTLLPGVGQAQIERNMDVEVEDLSFATQTENNLIQKDIIQSMPAKDNNTFMTQFGLDPNFSLDNTKLKINPSFGAEDNKFKVNPIKKQF